MDVIITAGGTFKPDDLLYQQFGIKKKALIPMLDRPMISWVLDALRDSGVVDDMVIVGLDPDELNYDYARLHFLPSTGNLVDNILTGLTKLREIHPEIQKLLIFSSDIPLITPESVQGFVEECSLQEGDMYYGIVKQETMEAVFPGSKRTFIPFKGGRYSGGDAFLADVVAADGSIELAKEVTGSRKNAFKQARMIGFDFIIRFLLRTMTVQEAALRASKKVRFEGRVVVTRFPELGMDVDKPHQYDMVKAILEKRQHQKA